MDIGERLKQARLNAGFSSQKQVTDALGLERTRYLKWEHGDAQPPIDMLVRLCKLFGVSSDYLLGLEDIDHTTRLTAREVAALKRMLGTMMEGKDEAR